jgi:hypothetical protein
MKIFGELSTDCRKIGAAPHAPQFFTMHEIEDKADVEEGRAFADESA